MQKVINDVTKIGIQAAVSVRCVSLAPCQRKVPVVIMCIFFASVPSLVVVTACGAPRMLETGSPVATGHQ